MGGILMNNRRRSSNWLSAVGCCLVFTGSLLGQVNKAATTSLPFETGFELSAGWSVWGKDVEDLGLAGGWTKGIDFFIDLPLQERFSLQMGMGIAEFQFDFNGDTHDFSIAKLKMFPRFYFPKWKLGVAVGGVLGFVNLENGIQENGLLLEGNDFSLGPVLDISYRLLSLKHLRIYLSSKSSWLAAPVMEIKNGQNIAESPTLVASVFGIVFTYR